MTVVANYDNSASSAAFFEHLSKLLESWSEDIAHVNEHWFYFIQQLNWSRGGDLLFLRDRVVNEELVSMWMLQDTEMFDPVLSVKWLELFAVAADQLAEEQRGENSSDKKSDSQDHVVSLASLLDRKLSSFEGLEKLNCRVMERHGIVTIRDLVLNPDKFALTRFSEERTNEWLQTRIHGDLQIGMTEAEVVALEEGR